MSAFFLKDRMQEWKWPADLQDRVLNFFDGIDPDTYEYADNFRIARLGNKEEEAHYNTLAESGCCGYFDSEYTLTKSKIVVRMGFNYGH